MGFDFGAKNADPTPDEVEVQGPLTVTELQFVNWIEQYWHKYSKFPPVDTMQRRWGQTLKFQEVLTKNTCIIALSNRGISVPLVDGSVPDELTPEQVAAVALILDYGDKRSHNTKLRSLGIAPGKWQGWLKQEAFKSYLHSLSAQGLDDALHVAHSGLIHATERGDTNAIKYYMELTGRFSGDTGSAQNFRVMLQRLVESIQRHVKDPDVLRLIASDFEMIQQGQIPPSVPVLERGSI